MVRERRTRPAVVISVMALALAVALLPGCGTKGDTVPKTGSVPKTGPTALDNLGTARSALSTMAPDARLLTVRLAGDTLSVGQIPVWVYFFGSPSTDKGYIVGATDGLSMGAREVRTVGLSSSDWAAVPGTGSWKIDSDVAYTKALEVSGLSDRPKGYMMGVKTYRFSTDTSTVEPFVWRVLLYPGVSGETTIHVDVNATTGEASVRK